MEIMIEWLALQCRVIFRTTIHSVLRVDFDIEKWDPQLIVSLECRLQLDFIYDLYIFYFR